MSHDLSVVRHIADRIAVMYLGRIVEIASSDELFGAPAHPYTQALISAITGDVPNLANPSSGCRFRTCCPLFAAHLTDAQRHRCTEEVPALITHHPTACHYTELSTLPALSGLSVVIGDDLPRSARAMRGREGG